MTDWFARPVLHVKDVEASLRFYVDQLGFTSPWRYDEDGTVYVAQVERQGCALILADTWPEKIGKGLMFISLNVEPQTREAAVAALDALRAELEAKGAPDPSATVVQEFLHLTVRFVDARTAQVQGYIDGSRAQFQNVSTVADVQAELDSRFAKMAIEVAKQSTPEDDQPRPKVGAVVVKHGQLLGVDCRTAVESNGKKNGQHAEYRLTSTSAGGALDGATIYTALEPCLNRSDPKVSCADRLISVKWPAL